MRGKVEVRESTNLLDDTDLDRALKNTATHGSLILDPQIEYTPTQIRGVKNFYNEYFEKVAHATEAKALAKETLEEFAQQKEELERWHDQASSYPFLRGLTAVISDLEDLGTKPYTWFITELTREEDKWFDYKDKIVDPILTFMKGSNKGHYDDARSLVSNNKDNLSYVDGVELSDINSALVDPDIYTGNAIQNLLANTKALNTQLDALIQDERKQASASIETLEIKLFGYEQYQTLDPEKQEYLNTAITQAKEAIKSNSLVAMIRDRTHNFEEKQFPRLIDQLVAWSEPTSAVEPPVGHPYNGAGGEVDQPAVAPTPPRAATISARDISVSFEKPWLSDEADVDAYVERYKDALIDAVKNGKKVRV